MIGNFEKKSAVYNLSDNVINYSNLSAIDSLFLCSTSTSFTTTEFATETEWQERLTANTIYQIKNILEVQNQSEAIKLYESKFNFRYKVAPGKYRFLLLVNIDLEYFVRLEKLEGQQIGCYFADINNNLYGVLSSGNVVPFSLEFIGIQKLSLGTHEMCLAGLLIDFYDTGEFDICYIANPTWSTDELLLVYWNEEQSETFTRNNCDEGKEGTEVIYTVAANTYSSKVSVNAANQLALNDIEANGQDYANTNGSCYIPIGFPFNSDFSNWENGLPIGWSAPVSGDYYIEKYNNKLKMISSPSRPVASMIGVVDLIPSNLTIYTINENNYFLIHYKIKIDEFYPSQDHYVELTSDEDVSYGGTSSAISGSITDIGIYEDTVLVPTNFRTIRIAHYKTGDIPAEDYWATIDYIQISEGS